jgi:hypothetical protein
VWRVYLAEADKLDVTVVSRTVDDATFEWVALRVNGRDLADLVRDVELPYAERDGQPDIAGSYMGLSPREALHPSRHLLDDPDLGLSAHDTTKTTLLACGGCGEPGCWPLLADVRVEDDVVRWSSFEQPYRPKWDLAALGPFTFERSQYEAALRRGTTPP